MFKLKVGGFAPNTAPPKGEFKVIVGRIPSNLSIVAVRLLVFHVGSLT